MLGYPDLVWFPKPFGAGDMDGVGQTRILGRPEVNLSDLLVREMAQNSWDARLKGAVPGFTMNYRMLDDKARDVLYWNVLGGRWSDSLGLEEAFDGDELWALEVSDSGTKGLGGPTRNDIDPPEGVPSDYADFVLSLGAPPDDGYGGGTYGFGKTAAYMASRCSTIVIWSRARNASGDFDERFIASAMGARFNLDGQRYSGRQWWGVSPSSIPAGGFAVEPATGRNARILGEAIFRRRFGPEESGTSILVLQPSGDGDDKTLVEQWARAISRNLWPKLDERQPAERRMQIELQHEGQPVTLDAPSQRSDLAAAARCLSEVRRALAGAAQENPTVELRRIEHGVGRKLLGYVGLTRFLGDGQDSNLGVTDALVLMRDQTELVVRSDKLGPTSDGITQWVGVFKPSSELDPVFAKSEPPAHDAWNPSGLEGTERSYVNVALRRIKEAAAEFINPQTSRDDGPVATASTGSISAALSGLVGSAGGTVASPRAARQSAGGGPAKRQPKVDVLALEPVTRSEQDILEGRQTTRVAMVLMGATSPMTVAASLSLGVEGGSMNAEGLVTLDHWETDNGRVMTGDGALLSPGRRVYADVSYPAGLAVDINFRVERA